MPSLPSKKVPPPPKEPGTHTNAEVKEALHARALRRTVLITAVVFLLLACLAVVSNTARDTVGDTGKPRLLLVVAKGLSNSTVSRAMQSNKAPFMRLLAASGGSYAALSSTDAGANPLVSLLTGSAAAGAANTLSGKTSFLGWMKAQKKNTVVAAPGKYWSAGTAAATPCPQIGLLDTECSGEVCPSVAAAAYCNAYRKYITCDDCAQLYQNEITKAFETALNHSADAVYFQVGNLAEAVPGKLDLAVQERSEVNLLDAAIGRIALALTNRTSSEAENWLVLVTGDGDNAEKTAPLLAVVYTKGTLAQLNSIPTAAKTTDVYNTVLHWFKGSGTSTSSLLGICTNGDKVVNCK